jgi:glycosyltransferase involved in cell wall biosynthesis
MPIAPNSSRPLRVLLVAENISLHQSGETSVPYYYLDYFLARGIDVTAVCHARVEKDLRKDLPENVFARVHFIEDSWLQKVLWKIANWVHYRIGDLIFNQLIYVLTQFRMRATVRRLVVANGIDVVFQPTPISPKTLSYMFGFAAPVVIGPLCGGLELPAAFRHLDGPVVDRTIHEARRAASFMHRFVPGKLKAAALLVGNQRTANALPPGTNGKIFEVVESGVDLARWPPKTYPVQPADKVRFVFCGRLVDWKGAQYLVKAFAPLAREGIAQLDLIGDGELFESIKEQIAHEGIGHSVNARGRIPLEQCIELMRDGDVYVMPSLRECGGLALLEAMAIGLPIIATNWMGPAEYLNDSCGILVDPSSEQGFIDGFTQAMRKLATDPQLRQTLGEGARKRAYSGFFGWDRKVNRVLEILEEVVHQGPKQSQRAAAISFNGAPLSAEQAK